LTTQQTASTPDAVNQIPRYLLVGTPAGEKNPRVKEPPAETSVVSPSVMLPPLLSVSDAMEPAPEALWKRSRMGKISKGRLLNLIVGAAISDDLSLSKKHLIDQGLI